MGNVGLRPRATAVVIRDGKVLLVRNRGQRHFCLPGGGIRRRETVASAAVRELYKELRLQAVKVTRLPQYDFTGSTNMHHVCVIEANGEPSLRRLELSKFIWWDMKDHIPVFRHVTGILSKMMST